MTFALSEDQQLLVNTAELFSKRRYSEGRRAEYLATEAGFSPENWLIMAEAGLLGIAFSEELGGLGGSNTDLVLIHYSLGKSMIVEPLLAGPLLAGKLLEGSGNRTLSDKCIKKIISGHIHIALAHSEPNSRYAIDNVQCEFNSSDNGILINGYKTLVLGSGAADVFIVSARKKASVQQNGNNAIGLFLVDADALGLDRRDYRLLDGSVASELFFNDTLGQPLEVKFDVLESAITRTKLAICAEMVGAMETLFERTLDYIKIRKQFGQPIGKFQALQHRMSDLYASVELCKALLFHTAETNPDDPEFSRNVNGAKAYIGKIGVNVGEQAVQLHGGIGITDELIIGHGLKKILFLSRLFGDPATELERFAAKS